MTKRVSHAGIRRASHEISALGFHLVPCEPGSKIPLIAWKDAPSDSDAIDGWFDRFGSDINIAIHAGKSGVVVLDADSSEAEDWIAQHRPPTPVRVRSPRGGSHHYFSAESTPPPPAQNLFGIGLDVRAGASIVIVPPSWNREQERRWTWLGTPLSPSVLPTIPSSLVERPRPIPPVIPDPSTRCGPIRDITRWIISVESIQGSCGSNQCFKVACRLVDAGLPWDEAWRWLCHWNASGKAIPPWSEAELRHKLADAFARLNTKGDAHESARSFGIEQSA